MKLIHYGKSGFSGFATIACSDKKRILSRYEDVSEHDGQLTCLRCMQIRDTLRKKQNVTGPNTGKNN